MKFFTLVFGASVAIVAWLQSLMPGRICSTTFAASSFAAQTDASGEPRCYFVCYL
jgi:hypothetical protein